MPTYPGLSAAMSQAVDDVRFSKSVDVNKFNVKRQIFHHRLPLVTAGVLAAQTFRFFQAPAAKNVTNWYGASGLPTDAFMWAQAFRFKLEYGKEYANGAPDTVGASISVAATSLTPGLFEQIKFLMESGLVNMKVGDRTIIDSVYGLESFPAGKGPDAALAIGVTNASLTGVGFALNNGMPVTSNAFQFAPWAAILPGKSLTCDVEFQSSTIPTQANTDIILRAELEGIVISPANG